MHYFFLGNTPSLSTLELNSLIGHSPDLVVGEAIVGYESLEFTNFDLLGGTRKIAVQLATTTPNDLPETLRTLILAVPHKNIAITTYDASLNLNLYALKTSVSQTRPVRFVSMETSEHELIMLTKQHVYELNLLRVNHELVVAATTWIFPSRDWVTRDRYKPYRDIKSGMLPPKLARIMVNLALGGQPGRVLADPFCGTGTVLTEALLVGCSNVIGADTSPSAVTGSERNLDWAIKTYGLNSVNYQVIQQDATHLDQVIKQVDAVATEPYMGPLLNFNNPLPQAKLQDIAKGLDKLYRGTLKSLSKILSAGGRVVITLPSFAAYGREIPTTSVDTLTALGYNLQASVAYGKSDAIVIRNITILEKT